ncbi:MAG: methyltransferase domain-containing protein [Chloroflexi bacterium]|nr:methyltransferase domain-containing protein [Chloroflexota bacterium]
MNDTKSAVQAQFGDTAENYRHSAVHAAGEDLRWLVRCVQDGKPTSVLDVGCGAGHVSVTVAPYVEQVVALDITLNMLRQVEILAQEKQVTNVRTQLGDAENLPFEEDQFDMVMSRYSAHHWPNPARALSEIQRVLKPNGRFILIDIVGFESYPEDTFLQCVELLRDPSHVRDYQISEWRRFFAQTGFSASVAMEWSLELDFDAWVARINTPPHRIHAIRDLFASTAETTRAALKYDATHLSLPAALFEARRIG